MENFAATEGDADVSVTYTYDLGTEAGRDAFEELETNETTRERLTARFENRMAGVAADASDETGRPMGVSGASLSADSADGHADGPVDEPGSYRR